MGEVAKHTARQASRRSSAEPEPLQVRFSPEVVRALRRIKALVEGSDHFAPEIWENLVEKDGYDWDGSKRKGMTVDRAINAVAHVIEETMHHVAATGDKTTERAVSDFTEALGRDGAIRLHQPKARGRH